MQWCSTCGSIIPTGRPVEEMIEAFPPFLSDIFILPNISSYLNNSLFLEINKLGFKSSLVGGEYIPKLNYKGLE